MTERAENLRLGSIEGAPRTISATIEYNIASTPGTREPSSTSLSMRPQPAGEGEREWENRPGAQLPGTVLPAGGTAGRPAGSVAPSSTLSAGGTSERPPGFVPPSSALPASN